MHNIQLASLQMTLWTVVTLCNSAFKDSYLYCFVIAVIYFVYVQVHVPWYTYPKDQILAVRLGGKCSYLLRHLAGPPCVITINTHSEQPPLTLQWKASSAITHRQQHSASPSRSPQYHEHLCAVCFHLSLELCGVDRACQCVFSLHLQPLPTSTR